MISTNHQKGQLNLAFQKQLQIWQDQRIKKTKQQPKIFEDSSQESAIGLDISNSHSDDVFATNNREKDDSNYNFISLAPKSLKSPKIYLETSKFSPIIKKLPRIESKTNNSNNSNTSPAVKRQTVRSRKIYSTSRDKNIKRSSSLGSARSSPDDSPSSTVESIKSRSKSPKSFKIKPTKNFVLLPTNRQTPIKSAEFGSPASKTYSNLRSSSFSRGILASENVNVFTSQSSSICSDRSAPKVEKRGIFENNYSLISKTSSSNLSNSISNNKIPIPPPRASSLIPKLPRKESSEPPMSMRKSTKKEAHYPSEYMIANPTKLSNNNLIIQKNQTNASSSIESLSCKARLDQSSQDNNISKNGIRTLSSNSSNISGLASNLSSLIDDNNILENAKKISIAEKKSSFKNLERLDLYTIRNNRVMGKVGKEENIGGSVSNGSGSPNSSLDMHLGGISQTVTIRENPELNFNQNLPLAPNSKNSIKIPPNTKRIKPTKNQTNSIKEPYDYSSNHFIQDAVVRRTLTVGGDKPSIKEKLYSNLNEKLYSPTSYRRKFAGKVTGSLKAPVRRFHNNKVDLTAIVNEKSPVLMKYSFNKSGNFKKETHLIDQDQNVIQNLVPGPKLTIFRKRPVDENGKILPNIRNVIDSLEGSGNSSNNKTNLIRRPSNSLDHDFGRSNVVSSQVNRWVEEHSLRNPIYKMI